MHMFLSQNMAMIQLMLIVTGLLLLSPHLKVFSKTLTFNFAISLGCPLHFVLVWSRVLCHTNSVVCVVKSIVLHYLECGWCSQEHTIFSVVGVVKNTLSSVRLVW